MATEKHGKWTTEQGSPAQAPCPHLTGAAQIGWFAALTLRAAFRAYTRYALLSLFRRQVSSAG